MLHEVFNHAPHDAGKPLKPNVDGSRKISMMGGNAERHGGNDQRLGFRLDLLGQMLRNDEIRA